MEAPPASSSSSKWVVSILFILLTGSSLVCECTEEIPIGLIVSDWNQNDGVYPAIEIALERQQRLYNQTNLIRFHRADKIKTVDAFKLSKIICKQFSSGIFALMGTVDPESFDTLHSYANAFEMPFVTPWFPESIYNGPKDTKVQEYALQIRPEYHEGLVSLINYYGWDKIIYVYSDFEGLIRLQNVYNSIPKDEFGVYRFQVEMVKKISTAQDVIEFLLELEKINRNTLKRVLLDCSPKIAKEILVSHVNNVHLGRRNFHYLMANLVLEDSWESTVAEYGAINVTGLRLFNGASEGASASFLRRWRQKTDGGMTTVAALAHDAVLVMEAAFNRIVREKPKILRRSYGASKDLTCNMTTDERQRTWEHGAAIVQALREVRLRDGGEANGGANGALTGKVEFDPLTGKRTRFSLDVLEMTPASKLVKIGTWSDTDGLNIAAEPFLHRGHSPRHKHIQNRTYVMTTILEEPYMMIRRQDPDGPPLTGNDRFEGYCKDLADIIARENNVNFEIRPVKDGKYGSPDKTAPGGWNGMIGELVRREAEIAIAPLTINSQREQVADFTKPFMSLGISIMIKKPVKKRPGVFSFMSPLSMEIWGCVVFAYIGVSIVLFLVSRFSPQEWKIEGTLGGTTTVANAFSVMNSLWFALGALMQQGTDLAPRSLSGRIVGGAWWFFSLILISSYTANLAAFLTVERMVTPIKSADELSQQTEIEYGALVGGSTLSFFKNSKISVYARMWEFMSARPYVLTNTTQEGIERVRKSKSKYAFLIESTNNEYTNERLPCDTMKVGKNLDAKGYGIATAKGSGLQEQINLSVLNLKENGELAKLKNKWWYENTECQDNNEQQGSSLKNELLLSNVAGIFFILVGGLIVAMAAALCEFCYNSGKEARRAKTSMSDAMKNKARLALTGGRDVDSVRFYGDSSAL